MICGRKLCLILLLFLVALGPCLYSLSEEEKEALPLLSKAILIEIILEYDKGLTIAEDVLEKEKEILAEDKTALKIQEELFLKSLEMQEEIMTKNKFLYGIGGLMIGYIMAEIINGG